ncbi:MAG: hypothetical protein ACE5H9_19415 [Anaerolineae bacterium]
MPSPKSPQRRFTGLQTLIIAGLVVLNVCVLGGLIAVWRPVWTAGSPPAVAQETTATPTPRLPPTWTPTPIPPLGPPTATPTRVVTGPPPAKPPTPTFTPAPRRRPRPSAAVIDLARIMQGESPGDLRAAYYVGWVAKNRVNAEGYGRTYAEVAGGFNGYRVSGPPREEFLDLARRVIRARRDPTRGSLYALSHADLNNLNLSPDTATAGSGLWYFFREWPHPRRY